MDWPELCDIVPQFLRRGRVEPAPKLWIGHVPLQSFFRWPQHTREHHTRKTKERMSSRQRRRGYTHVQTVQSVGSR